MAHLFLTPKKIIYGKDALVKSGPYIQELGRKALIVTDHVMVSTGNVQKLTDLLDKIQMKYEIYAEINSEPTDKMLYAGLAIYNDTHCDLLIGLGGGSPIDAAKAIGAMIANPGKLADYMGREIENMLPGLVAIPTTAGTGSEATQFTIITDTESDVKMLLKGAVLLPSLAVVDPGLTVTSPAKVTAATGIDALTHAVEAYTSRKAQPMTDMYAISACKRIFKSLPHAYADGANLEARNQMSMASLEAGIAFNNASVTLVHGMSRPIGALFHVPHGISNAMLIEECLKFAAQGAVERFADIAKATGLYKEGMSDSEAAEALIQAIHKLCKQLNIPTLLEYGVNKDEYFASIEKMAKDALASGSPDNTIRRPNKDDIITLYKNLWK